MFVIECKIEKDVGYHPLGTGVVYYRKNSIEGDTWVRQKSAATTYPTRSKAEGELDKLRADSVLPAWLKTRKPVLAAACVVPA